MFSQRHMIEIARIISSVESVAERMRLAYEFARTIGATNPRFKREKFFPACGVMIPPGKCSSNKG